MITIQCFHVCYDYKLLLRENLSPRRNQNHNLKLVLPGADLAQNLTVAN